MKISQLSIDERPMERLLKHGVQSLSNAELLSILIRTGNKENNALDLAHNLLGKAGGNLTSLGSLSLENICEVKGIGKGKAMNILVSLEIGKRYLEEGLDTLGKTIKDPEEVFQIMLPKMKSLIHEELWAIWLSPSQKVIGYDKITSGGTVSTIIDSKQIIKKAIEKNAAAVVIVHNHPSGNPQPSMADIKETSTLRDNCSALGISILDHVIVSDNAFFSFADAKIRHPKNK